MCIRDRFWVGRWLSQVLKESPFEVEVAGISENGEEAFKALTDTRPDILITDINMPLIDGLDVLKRLEEAGEKPVSYTHLDVYKRQVLLRIVQAEAGVCDEKGKILVANVVLNLSIIHI